MFGFRPDDAVEHEPLAVGVWETEEVETLLLPQHRLPADSRCHTRNGKHRPLRQRRYPGGAYTRESRRDVDPEWSCDPVNHKRASDGTLEALRIWIRVHDRAEAGACVGREEEHARGAEQPI